MTLADKDAATGKTGWVFFDRGLIDAASALESETGAPVLRALDAPNRYHRQVFLVPPWSEIYTGDAERRHGFDVGLAEYHRLETVLPALGYSVIMLPKISVSARADFVLAALEL